MSNSTVYRQAAKLVRRNWTQKEFTNEHGGVCALQAVAQAMGIDTDQGELPQDVVDEMFDELTKFNEFTATTMEEKRVHIYRWNDEAWRRKKDVIHLMLRLANRPDKLDEEEDVTAPRGELVGAC